MFLLNSNKLRSTGKGLGPGIALNGFIPRFGSAESLTVALAEANLTADEVSESSL